MKISQLEHILAVERLGSINLAAEQLYISQPLLSSSIKSLEHELGGALFTRSNKGVALTPFGKEFLPYAKSVMTQIEQMKRLGQQSYGNTQSLVICNNGYRFVSDLVADVYNRHSTQGISIKVYDCTGTQTIEMVSDHLAEIGVLRVWDFQKQIILKQSRGKNLEFYPLAVLPIAVVVGRKNPLFHQQSDIVTVEQLKNFSSIRLSYMQFNPVASIYEKFPELNSKNHFYVSSRSMLYEILPQTDNYIITSMAVDAYRKSEYYPNTRVLRLANCDHYAQLGWIKNRTTNLSPLAQQFTQLLNEYL